MIYYQFCDYTF